MSSEKLSNPTIPQERTVACLGRNCIFAAHAFGELVTCEGAQIRLLAQTRETSADGTSGALRHAVYAQHCPERVALGKGDVPVGHVVYIKDDSMSPADAIQVAEAYQTDEAVPISLAYGESTLVNQLPQQAPVQPKNQV